MYRKPFSELQLFPERLGEPLHWRKPQRVFVGSQTDLFHAEMPSDKIAEVFGVMSIADNHTTSGRRTRPPQSPQRAPIPAAHRSLGRTPIPSMKK